MFVDGLGLGDDDPQINPLAAAELPFLRSLLGSAPTRSAPAFRRLGALFTPLDATLGHAGLPQSATGQSTLLTGQNGAEVMRGHYGPYPGPTLKKILDAGTLFTDVLRSGGQVALANAFPPGYFAALSAGKLRVNVPVYAAQRAGVPLLTLADHRQGEAISADLDGRYLHGLDARSAPRSPEKAGRTLADLAQRPTLTFFDFWLPDTAGHRWGFAESAALLETFDAFLSGLIPALGEVTLLLTSDHGNLEDKSSRSHTRNAVPLLVRGPLEPHFAEATSLLDVAPAVRRALDLRASPS